MQHAFLGMNGKVILSLLYNGNFFLSLKTEKLRDHKRVISRSQLCKYQEKIEQPRVAQQRAEHEENAGDHPGGDGGHTFHVGRHICDGVEDVYENEKYCDEQRHSAGDHLRRDQEAGPRHHHKQSAGKVVDVEVSDCNDGGDINTFTAARISSLLGRVPSESHLESGGRVIAGIAVNHRLVDLMKLRHVNLE